MLRGFARTTLALLTIFHICPAYAAETNLQYHVESFAQYRDLNQKGFSKNDNVLEGFVLTDVGWSWTGQSLFAEIKPQLRGLVSPGVAATGPKSASVAPSKRWLNSRRLITDDHDDELYFDFDRIGLRYRFSSIEFWAGRRPISFGVLRLFPVWNKLTLPLIFQPGPEWIDNPDSVGAVFQHDLASLRIVALRGDDLRKDALNLAELKLSPGFFDLQFLIADWWQRAAMGAAIAVDYVEATWRLEAIQFSRENSGPDPELLQWGLGVERAVGSKWTVIIEYFQQTNCQNLGTGYGLAPPSRLQALAGCRYLFPYAGFQLNSAWRLGGGVLANIGDPSFMTIGDFEYTWTDNLQLILKLKWATGADRREFGSRRFEDGFGHEAGAQSTVYGGLSYTM